MSSSKRELRKKANYGQVPVVIFFLKKKKFMDKLETCPSVVSEGSVR